MSSAQKIPTITNLYEAHSNLMCVKGIQTYILTQTPEVYLQSNLNPHLHLMPTSAARYGFGKVLFLHTVPTHTSSISDVDSLNYKICLSIIFLDICRSTMVNLHVLSSSIALLCFVVLPTYKVNTLKKCFSTLRMNLWSVISGLLPKIQWFEIWSEGFFYFYFVFQLQLVRQK